MGDDCTGLPDPELERLYTAAIYRVEFPAGAVAFRIGEWLQRAPGPFAVITAWNPGSRMLPAHENERRNEELAAMLRRMGARLLPAEGVSPDGSYREASFAAFGITAAQALEAARAFGQAAIAWHDESGTRLLWC